MGNFLGLVLEIINSDPNPALALERYVAMERENAAHDAKAEAWDEGHAASERDWKLTFDITTPDEERQPLTNPYRD